MGDHSRRHIYNLGRRPGSPVTPSGAACVLLFCLLWAVIAGPLGAADQAPAGVEVRVSAEPQVATVGDFINIDMLIIAPEGYAVRIPDPGRRIAAFDVLEFFPGPAVPRGQAESRETAKGGLPSAHSVVHRARIVAAIYKTGEFEFPALQITLQDPAGKETTVASRPVRVRIQSVLGAGDQQLKDPKKQADIPEPLRWWLWLAVVAGILVILAALYRLRRRTVASVAPAPAAHPMLDPLDAAEAELRSLLDSRLLEKGDVKQFYVSLADVVKKMLEAGYGIQTLEKTSSEILEELSRETAHHPGATELEQVAGLMTGCDLVKFAKYIPGEQENGTAVGSAFRILEACKKARHAPPAPLGESLPETS